MTDSRQNNQGYYGFGGKRKTTSENPSERLNGILGSNIRLSTNVDLDGSDEEISAHSSTSGVSSLLPHNHTSHKPSKPLLKTTSMDSSTNKSMTTSIAVDPIPRPWSVANQSSIYDSRPAKRVRLTHNSSSAVLENSFFYNASTSYGGASSCRKTNLSSVFQPTVPLRFEVESNDVKQDIPKFDTTMSTTARRILDSLEHFSSPLSSSIQNEHLTPFKRAITHPVPPNNSPVIQSFRTKRYPPYMEAYNRYKAFKRQSSAPTAKSSDLCSTNESVPIDATTSSSNTAASIQLASAGLQQTPFSTKKSRNDHQPKNPPLTINSKLDSIETSTSVQPSSSSFIQIKPCISAVFTFAPPSFVDSNLESVSIRLSTSQIPDNAYKFCEPVYGNSSSRLLSSNDSNTTTTRSSLQTNALKSLSKIPTCIELPTTYSAPGWRCQGCLVENADFASCCTSCSLPRIVVPKQVSQPVFGRATSSFSHSTAESIAKTSSSIISSFQPSQTNNAKWECPTCMIFNKLEVESCVCCSTVKPTTTGKQDPAEKLTSSTFSLPSSNMCEKWSCPTCMVLNKDEIALCPCCQTAKPNNTPKPKLTSSYTTTGSPPVILSSCKTNKPGSTNNSTLVMPTIASHSSVSEAASSKWECPTCLVHNPATRDQCPCCSTKRPGTVITSKSNDIPSTSVGSVPSFSFGQPMKPSPSLSLPSSPLAPPSFGTPVGQESSTNTSSFGKSVISSSTTTSIHNSTKCTSATSAISGFKFGSTPTTAYQVPTTSSEFKFGTVSSNVSTNISATPEFKFGSAPITNQVPTTFSGFKFGSTSCTPSNITPTTPGFKIGSAPTTTTQVLTASSEFKFGSVSSVTCTNTATTTLGFESTPTSSVKDQVPTISSGFNFGSIQQFTTPITTDSSLAKINGFTSSDSEPDKKSSVSDFKFGKNPGSDFAFSSNLAKNDMVKANTETAFQFGAAAKPLSDSSSNTLQSSSGLFIFGSTTAQAQDKSSMINNVAFGAQPQSFGAIGQSSLATSDNPFAPPANAAPGRQKASAVRRIRR